MTDAPVLVSLGYLLLGFGVGALMGLHRVPVRERVGWSLGFAYGAVILGAVLVGCLTIGPGLVG